MPGARRPGPICGATRNPEGIWEGMLCRTITLDCAAREAGPEVPGYTPATELATKTPDKDLSSLIAGIFSRQLFPALFQTPSYAVILEKAGLAPPFEGQDAAVFTPRYRQTWAMESTLIAKLIHSADSLEPDSLKCEILRPGTSIYRLLGEDQAPDPRSWSYGTNYVGDWWFDQETWELVLSEAGAVDPSVTTMSANRVIRSLLRRYLAIAIDWTKGAKVCHMQVPSKGELPVVTGLGKPIPVYSPSVKTQILQTAYGTKYIPGGKSLGSPHMRFGHMMLPGGRKQYWLPFTPERAIITVVRDLDD